MKMIQAIIRPHKLQEVRDRMRDAGVSGMTICEVRGFGRTGGRTEVFHGSTYTVDFVPKIKIEIVVPDQYVPDLVRRIAAVAKTDKLGDGKIFVTPVEEAVRIRTGEHGEDAI
jgi:nitrogen regulatory protein P-II 1